MIKTLLIDGDGVALKKHRYFSDIYVEENDLPKGLMTPFFKGDFILCQKGQADLKEKLSPFLLKWNLKDSLDEFLNKWFNDETEPDKEVLDIIQQIRAKGIKCYLVTDQERYRAQFMNNVWQIGQYFDGALYSCDIGHRKAEEDYFQVVMKNLNLKPEETAYIDDDPENLEIAGRLGIKGILYNGIQDLNDYLNN